MVGRLRIIKCLPNPARRAKKKKAKGLRRSARPKKRRAKSAAGKFVLRAVTPAGVALWRTRQGWTKTKRQARTFGSIADGEKAWKSAALSRQPGAWVVVDVQPL